MRYRESEELLQMKRAGLQRQMWIRSPGILNARFSGAIPMAEGHYQRTQGKRVSLGRLIG